MKSKILIVLSVLVLGSFSQLKAQKYTSPVKKIYDQVSDAENISAVYITSGMLHFSMSLASAMSDDEKIDSLKNLVKSMNEIILIGNMGPSMMSSNAIKELKNELAGNDYQLMVNMKENGEELSVFVLEDAQAGKIKDFVVIMNEHSEGMMLSISGLMTYEQLAGVAALADIDVGDFIPIH